MLKIFDQDTIAAIATAPGEGGIGVIRISCADSVAIADKIFEASSKKPVSEQENFTVRHGFILSRERGASKKIDEVLLLVMRGPKSFTGEDVVEISAHGGTAVLKFFLYCTKKTGARPAERGEFTKRAFLN